jgi:methylthioribulose-1-phosphate dehydratase
MAQRVKRIGSRRSRRIIGRERPRRALGRSMRYNTSRMRGHPDPRQVIADLCRQFYAQGWFSGTGGSISIREGDRIYMAPSGVQKERLDPQDLFTLDLAGNVVARPADEALRLSQCAPLFLNAYRTRDAGAVLHSHSQNAMLATLVYYGIFRITHLEMMKGIAGTGYRDVLEVPIIENTAEECDLAESMAEAMDAFPRTYAVLVRRHGVYVWGRDWVQAKNHAECYDYLFGAAVRMRQLGLDPARPPGGGP